MPGGGTRPPCRDPPIESSWRLRPRTGGNDAATSEPIVTRRKPQKTGIAKVLGGVAGALPGAGKKKGASGGGKGRTAGLALLAGAAGLALKNRDKLTGMVRSKGSGTGDRTAHADAPANPVVVTEGPAAKAGTPPSAPAT
jgi:hypothetical protein